MSELRWTHEGTKHSSATAWRSRGMSLKHVRRMLRQRDARSTERYGKLAHEALVEAFRARADRMRCGWSRWSCFSRGVMREARTSPVDTPPLSSSPSPAIRSLIFPKRPDRA